MTGPSLRYAAYRGDARSLYHVFDANDPSRREGHVVSLCGDEIPLGAIHDDFPRINPAAAAQRYRLCPECEPDQGSALLDEVTEGNTASELVAVSSLDSDSDETHHGGATNSAGSVEPAPEAHGPNALHDAMARAASGYRRYQQDRRMAVIAYLEGGQALFQARELARHGEWLPLLAEFGIPERQARRMMQLAREFGANADAVLELGGIRAALESLGKSDTVSELEEPKDVEGGDPEAGDDQIAHGGQFDEPEPLARPEEMADALDDLESENHELRNEVAVLKEQAPNRTQRLEAELEALSMDVSVLKHEKSELQMRLDWFEAQGSAYDVDHYKRVNDQQADIRTLQGRLNRLTNEREDARRQVRYWKAEAMKLGWKQSKEQAALVAGF